MPQHLTEEVSRTRIVGVGASTAGLESLEEFFAHVPEQSGLAYIVVQHLDAAREATSPAILQRVTSLPVREVTALMRVEPNVVFLVAPHTELTVTRDVIQLSALGDPQGLRMSIDVLFCSLARDRGDQAIGVVLSGLGSDGTVGLQAIKMQGGLTAAQDPRSAPFDSMPKSAIAAVAVDIVEPAAHLPQRIVTVVADLISTGAALRTSQNTAAAELSAVLDVLHNHSKRDLSLYKPTTLRRRIERRMAVHATKTMAEYAALLHANASEATLLSKEILIGVTGFFRDPEVWKELEDVVLPAMLAQSEPRTQLRAWVVGCSTGEEAYSLAMAFTEVRDRIPALSALTLQIFATDLNADAIAFARFGRYPAEISAAVSAERLRRFFRAQDDAYVISPGIRNMLLFSQHDVIMDPPFTRLDLLFCRNVLIYFGAALQTHLVPEFGYCLRPHGILVLGESETIGTRGDLFAPVSPRSRIYRRSTRAVSSADFPGSWRRYAPNAASALPALREMPAGATLEILADQLMLQRFSPPAVIVNELGDILYIRGKTGQFLEPPAGKANWNIHVMARRGIRAQLALALRRAVEEHVSVTVRGLYIEADATQGLDLTVEPIEAPKALAGLVVIVFREVAAPPVGTPQRTASSTDWALEAELVRALQEITALQQTMQASEEERRSAIEELRASQEEALSINDELQFINAELRSKLDELALAQGDLQNLLAATDIATLFLDKNLNLRRYTEQIKGVFGIRNVDIGRPLSELSSTLNYPELQADLHHTLHTLICCDREVSTTDAHWLRVRIMPYRSAGDVIQGIVMTIIDITAARNLQSRLGHA